MLSLKWKDKKSGVEQRIKFDVVTRETHDALMEITAHPVEEGADVVDHARPKPAALSIDGFVSNKPLWSNPGVGEKVWDESPVAPLYEKKIVELAIRTPTRGLRPKRRQLVFEAGGYTNLDKPPLKLNAASLVSAGVSAIVNLIKGNPGTYAALAAEAAAGNATARALLIGSKETFEDRARAMYEVLIGAQNDRALITVTSSLTEISNLLLAKVSVPRTVETGNGADFSLELTQVRIVKSETVDAPEPAEKRGEKQKSLGSQTPKTDPNGEKKDEVAASFLYQGRESLTK